MKKHWKFKMEKELMEEFKVVYVKGDKNKSLGCIAWLGLMFINGLGDRVKEYTNIAQPFVE
jgi:hypothetical protein